MDEQNNKVCESTNEKPVNRFLKEKEYLVPLPNKDILERINSKPIERKVSKESMIVYSKAKYSVDPKYIGKVVTIKPETNKLHLYYNNIHIKTHDISNKLINYTKEDMISILKSNVYKHMSDDQIEHLAKEQMKIYDKL